jgi:hypothetical protein
VTLALAAHLADRDVVRDLISVGVPLDVPSGSHHSPKGPPLLNALWNKDDEVLMMLLRAGASKNDPKTIDEVWATVRRTLRWQGAAAILQSYGDRVTKK